MARSTSFHKDRIVDKPTTTITPIVVAIVAPRRRDDRAMGDRIGWYSCLVVASVRTVKFCGGRSGIDYSLSLSTNQKRKPKGWTHRPNDVRDAGRPCRPSEADPKAKPNPEVTQVVWLCVRCNISDRECVCVALRTELENTTNFSLACVCISECLCSDCRSFRQRRVGISTDSSKSAPRRSKMAFSRSVT